MAGGDNVAAHDWQTPSSDVMGLPQLGQIRKLSLLDSARCRAPPSLQAAN